MARPTPLINLSQEQNDLLESLERSREMPHSLVLRARLILKAAAGMNNKTIGQELGIEEHRVGLWRRRWLEGCAELEKYTGKPKALRRAVSRLLSDKARSGSPGKFSAEQVCQLIALACETPPEYLSHWTYKELAQESVRRGIAPGMSKTTVGRFLKSGRPETASQQILALSIAEGLAES